MNEKLLGKFLWRFYGYGDWSAPIWFLGMEEAGGDSVEEIDRRLQLWDAKGQPDLLDVHDLLKAVGNERWIGQGARLQNTWKELIRLQQAFEDKPTDNESVRSVQAFTWLRADSRTCGIELFPLPCGNLRHWPYREWSTSPHLVNRTIYQHATFAHRARQIAERIKTHHPKVVVCYGTTYHDFWEGVSGGPITRDKTAKFSFVKRGGTCWVVVPHPVARDVVPDDFREIGSKLRGLVT